MNKRRLKFHQLKPGMLILFTKPDIMGDRSYTDHPIRVSAVFPDYITYESYIFGQWKAVPHVYPRKLIDNRMLLVNYKMKKVMGVCK